MQVRANESAMNVFAEFELTYADSDVRAGCLRADVLSRS